MPPAPSSAARPKKRISSVTIGLLGCLLPLAVVVIGAFVWLIVTGWSLFADQARTALQDDAVMQAQIGQIHTMRLDLYRTSLAPGIDDFVFEVEGERGGGRVHATLVSEGADRELLTGGVLTLHDGRYFPLGGTDGGARGIDVDANDFYKE
nr:hypothetical protein [Xanthomonas sp. CFBP 8152]